MAEQILIMILQGGTRLATSNYSPDRIPLQDGKNNNPGECASNPETTRPQGGRFKGQLKSI